MVNIFPKCWWQYWKNYHGRWFTLVESRKNSPTKQTKGRDDTPAVLLNELPITTIQGSFFVNLGNMCLLFYSGQKHPDKSALEQGTVWYTICESGDQSWSEKLMAGQLIDYIKPKSQVLQRNLDRKIVTKCTHPAKHGPKLQGLWKPTSYLQGSLQKKSLSKFMNIEIHLGFTNPKPTFDDFSGSQRNPIMKDHPTL